MLGTLALLAALAVGAPSASAVIVRLKNGKAISYMPLRGQAHLKIFDPFFNNLDYNGGPVMPSNTNYTVYWAPGGEGAYPEGYITGIDEYLENLAHDSGGNKNVDSVATQYNDSEGHFAAYSSHFGGKLIDKDAYPKNGCKHATICLTDKQLQNELEEFVVKEKKPMNLETEYFLLTPEGVESCFEETGPFAECSAGAEEEKNRAFCAYHSNFAVGEGQLIYANDPYVVANLGCEDGNHPNNKPSDGALQGGLSHEHNESTTDPEPNSAWTYFAENQGEIGDKCAGQMGPALGEVEIGPLEFAKFNQVVNGVPYWYQEEWSNQGATCMQRLAFKGSAPVAAFTAMPVGGSEIAFNASPSTGGVNHFSWQFNDGSPPVYAATPTVTHHFPGLATFTVALTVFAEDGTSDAIAREIEVGAPAPSAAFSAPSGSVGQSLSFDGSASSDPGHSITAYSWSFGDGTGASGASTTHAYGVPGTYEATLTVTSTSGLSGTVGHLVTVAGSEATGAPAVVASTGGPAGAPTATIAVLASSGRVRRGQTAIKLSCHGSAPRCSGRVVLSAIRIVHRGGRRLRRTVTIATASFNIAAGATATVQLHLNQLGRSLLRSAGGHLGTTLAIVRSSPTPSVTQTRRLRLHR